MAVMTDQDHQNLAMLIGRVIERVKAAPDVSSLSPQDAILATLDMMAHEFAHAREIIPMAPA